ncbi:DUF6114 domain-containing protein [Phytohabitans rumicis]|uniref:Uncharacterized protein n=1 Tax=Phytohabitans rumicis TaxID=1076125 RepID=A0A6V8L9K2_9ACTN|nr:DUF6114 domain-containing protein [Phytohabitans rumicis]GFJ90756.1 hypothetical protein Prum_043980 [Phytohabitans rumicis]
MTTPNLWVRGWRAFRGWRRSRPFWGGLFTLLAGLEIFATTQMSLAGLTFQMGPTGFLSWLIPTILATCGLLMWFTPQHRLFYAIVAAVTAVFSLIGVNLGGFLIGLLFGMVGSALGFAWVQVPSTEGPASPAEPEGAQPEPDDDATVDDLLSGEQPPRHRTQLFAVTLILMSVAAVGVVTAPGAGPAYAAPCATTPAPTASAPATTATPSPTPAPAEGEDDGNIVTDIIEGIGSVLDGIGDLLGIGGTEESAAAEPTPSPSPSASASPSPIPTKKPCAPGTGTGTDEDGEDDEPAVVAAAQLDPPAGIQPISRTPSRMTGTKQTNWALKYVGVTALPVRGGGTTEVLWFEMGKSTTDDFELRPAIPGDKTMSLKSSALTVEGHVRFFTPRFTGKLLGLPQVYTPDSPPPLIPGVEIPLIPIVFTDIDIQLAYIDCDKLGSPDLINTLPS